MTSKEKMRKDLLTNIKFVGALYILTIGLFVYRLYQLFWAEVTRIDIYSKLIFGDYMVIALLIVATITLIVSIYLYVALPEKKIQVQHTTLLIVGILLLPYSLVILITGLKIGINNTRYEAKNNILGFLAMIVFIIFYGYLLVGFAGVEPEYTHSKTYEFEYAFDELNTINMTIEVVYRDNELLFVDIDALANTQELTELDPNLDRLAYVLEGSNLNGTKKLCLDIVSEGEALVEAEYSCRTTLEDNPFLVLEDVDTWEDFMLMAIYQDIEFAFDVTYLNITLINETYKDNYYE